jgi:hypothetical protein
MKLLDHVGPGSPIRTLGRELVKGCERIPEDQPSGVSLGVGQLLPKLDQDLCNVVLVGAHARRLPDTQAPVTKILNAQHKLKSRVDLKILKSFNGLQRDACEQSGAPLENSSEKAPA